MDLLQKTVDVSSDEKKKRLNPYNLYSLTHHDCLYPLHTRETSYYSSVMFGYFHMSPVSSNATVEHHKKRRCVEIIISQLFFEHSASSFYVYFWVTINLRKRTLYCLMLAFAQWELCIASDKLWKCRSMGKGKGKGKHAWWLVLYTPWAYFWHSVIQYAMQGEVKAPVLVGKKKKKKNSLSKQFSEV